MEKTTSAPLNKIAGKTVDKILVTGGAGFIGSHAVLALARRNQPVVVLDDFSNAKPSTIATIEKMTGQSITTIKGDIRDEKLLADIFTTHRIKSVLHFAGLKAVSESMTDPLSYFSVNVGGAISLLRAMEKNNIKKFIFSSSATVYDPSQPSPLTEQSPLAPINPYGVSKLMVEKILANLCAADPAWRVTALRYFNPCGADETGLIGEGPLGIPNNLMPMLLKVAGGEIDKLEIHGNDYDTNDGTGVRDYIHVVDLVAAHLQALDCLDRPNQVDDQNDDHADNKANGFSVFNLGRGHGHSVLEMLKIFEKSIGRNTPLPYKIMPRRPGDSATVWADASRANKILQWQASKDLETMCIDSWRFYQQNKK